MIHAAIVKLLLYLSTFVGCSLVLIASTGDWTYVIASLPIVLATVLTTAVYRRRHQGRGGGIRAIKSPESVERRVRF